MQPQATPSDSRILLPNVDINLNTFITDFRPADRVIISFRIDNITPNLDFVQPFFFTLSSESKNFERASAPLVTDAQLGGDGILSPGKTSERFQFEVFDRGDEVYTFFIDTSAVVPNEADLVCRDPITVPDADLESAIRNKLGKASGDDLTCADLGLLTALRANGGSIANLAGLQYAVNLTSLNLGENRIKDLTLLQNLTGLERLFLKSNEITNLAALQDFTNLKELSLGGNRIRNLTPLQNLTNLERLFLNKNQLTDLTGLQDLTNLRALNLSSNLIDNPDAFGVIKLQDLTPLQNLSSLESLTLSNNSVSDLSPLQALMNLETLYLRSNDLNDLTPPQNLTNLQTLSLNLNILENLDGLQTLTNLEILDLSFNNLNDLTPLQDLTNLRVLDLNANNLSDLSPLQYLTNIEAFFLENNRISDISALVANSGLDSGDVVSLTGNPLSSQANEDIATLVARGVRASGNNFE